MASIQDDRGYNQGFKPSIAMDIRMERRCDYMISQMDLSKKIRTFKKLAAGLERFHIFFLKKLKQKF
jgi:hypothetical protein